MVKRPATKSATVKKMSRKVKKSKDLSKCCAACAFFDKRNPKDTTCGLSGESVKPNDVCRRCATDSSERCQRCGKEIKYTGKNAHYNAMNSFQMVNGSGSSGQNLVLCKECSFAAWLLFEDMIEAIRENRAPSWSHVGEDVSNNVDNE